jgi:diguanylate cyclase (GGDEF)-like protein
VARDQFGFLWFGTESGLNKFDGYGFTVYVPLESNPNSLSNSWINALLVDRHGNIWVGTENGLNRYVYSRDRFERYLPDPADPASISSSRIFCLFEDRQDRLWVGTDRGLNLFDRNSRKFIVYRHDPAHPERSLSNDNIRAIAQDSAGLIWVGTVGGGLNILDPETGRITQLRASGLPADKNKNGPDSLSVSAPGSASSLNSRFASSATPNPGRSQNSKARLTTRLPDDYIYAIIIEPHTTPDSPPNHSSSQHLEQSPGTDIVWLGTASSGLVRYEPATGQFLSYVHNPSDAASISDNTVNCLLKDEDGTLWIGTDAGGLNHFDPGSETFVSYKNHPGNPASLADNRVLSLALSPERILWVGTYRGISQLNLNRQYFKRFLSNPYEQATSLPSPAVRAFCDHSSGVLYVGTDGGGITGFSHITRQVFQLRHNPSAPYSPDHPSSNQVFCLLEDRDGSLWIGTLGGGLDNYNPATRKFTHYRQQPGLPGSLPDDNIRSLYLDAAGTLWVGTVSRGLVYFDRATRRFVRPRVSKINYVSSISPANPPANSPANPAANSPAKPPANPPSNSPANSPANSPSDSFANSASHLPTSSPASSPSYTSASSVPGATSHTPTSSPASSSSHLPANPAANSPAPPSSAPDASTNPLIVGRIFSIKGDSRGYLWLAAYDTGLLRYNPTSGELLVFTHDPLNPHSLPTNSIITVFVDSHDNVWVGTNGGGLCVLRLDQDLNHPTFTRYLQSQGLPSSVIYAILEDDDGYLWLSSNRGLSRFDPRTGQFRNFDTTDGLQSYEFNGNAACKGRDGLLYFGGINGFNSFNPREISFSKFMPPVYLTNVLVNNIKLSPGQPVDGQVILEKALHHTREISLNWKHRVISFEFVALDYTCPEKNQYVYKLEGFDPDWNYTGTRRFASYSNLPPGHYTLRLKATNCDGLWNEAGTSLSIRVIPPFWRTTWAYLIYVLLGAAFVYGIMRFRLRQARQRERELQKQVDQRTEELRLANLKLQELATTDELTGVANFRRFRDFLDYEWRRAARNKKPVSLLLADLDDFKQFNDTLGHQAGDECLRRVAQAMVSACRRPSDLVCRYGGDEFALVLAETDLAGAYLVAENIRKKIEQLVIGGEILNQDQEALPGSAEKTAINSQNSFPPESGFSAETPPLSVAEQTKEEDERAPEQGSLSDSSNFVVRAVTVCLGCASLNPAEGGSPDELIAQADRALYKAKTSGKNLTSV